MYLNNSELLNSETLDYYGLLCEQQEHAEDQVGAKKTTAAAGKGHGDEDEEMYHHASHNGSGYSKNHIKGRDQDVERHGQQNHGKQLTAKRGKSFHPKFPRTF